jgi:hypothetical protein
MQINQLLLTQLLFKVDWILEAYPTQKSPSNISYRVEIQQRHHCNFCHNYARLSCQVRTYLTRLPAAMKCAAETAQNEPHSEVEFAGKTTCLIPSWRPACNHHMIIKTFHSNSSLKTSTPDSNVKMACSPRINSHASTAVTPPETQPCSSLPGHACITPHLPTT